VVPPRPLTAIVVFGREPVAGRVKTRLAAEIGDRAAARVYGRLLENTLIEAAKCGARAMLSLADPPCAAFEPPVALPVEVQSEGDLGRRMGDAFRRRFAEGFDSVLVVGSDCPALTAAHLSAGLDRLRSQHPAVLGPAPDGGYWLVGQSRPGADLFSGIPWSSPRTLEATRERLRDLGIRWAELPVLADVDTASDLDRILASGTLASGLAERIEQARRDSS
jgi:rSAM/selenodomain-associated transferase 1